MRGREVRVMLGHSPRNVGGLSELVARTGKEMGSLSEPPQGKLSCGPHVNVPISRLYDKKLVLLKSQSLSS